jgi:hypothetical protein
MATRKPPQDQPGEKPQHELPPRELIVIAEPAARLRSAGPSVESAAGRPVQQLNELLAKEKVRLQPLFGHSERRLDAARSAMGAAAARTPDLSVFYAVKAEDGRLDELASALARMPGILGAFVKPPAEPPLAPPARGEEEARVEAPSADAPPTTPDFTPRQIYLRPATAGVDADWAATQAGGRGDGIRIVDVEGAWNFSHEDLLQNQGGVIGGTPTSDQAWRDHGTAVAGEFGGDENGLGITGISPAANVRAISIFGGLGSAAAIRQAADALSAGDVILIELHRPGPRFNFQQRLDQRGYIAIEWWPDDLAAIRYAVGKGVIVVEAAGNGAEDLDDAIYDTPDAGFPASWANPFNTANPGSGAVLVGAGAPPPGTHGADHGPDRSRLDFSNYGARLDAQGWGREVTSTGYGGLQGGSENLYYTDTFSGTSSASPIVVGSLAAIQGILQASGKPRLTPDAARDVLRQTGSPQQDAPGRPATQRIGNRPDIRGAIAHLVASGIQSGIASQYWDELVAYPPGSAASLWLLVDNAWRKRDSASSTDRLLALRAFLKPGNRVRVWYQGTEIIGLVVENS